ncbi:MAG: dihydrolipoyl dehydrogenase [Actinomycetota bacterium]
MVVGEVATRTEVAVIGGGPGGYAVALRLAAGGREVTLVERDAVGGTCLNVGCIPSKALLHAADLAHLPVSAASTGVRIEATADLSAIRDHLDTVVDRLTGGVRQLLDAAGVTVVAGNARFSRPDRLAVEHGDDVAHLEFVDAVLATGSRPVELTGLPFDGERVLDSTGALALRELPDRLVIVGGGYIGVELATAFAKLGTTVTVAEAADRLLPGMPAHLARVVHAGLDRLDVDVRTGADGIAVVDEIQPDRVVVAVGRRPASDGLGLERPGVHVEDSGHVVVDPSRRATAHVWAIGDLTPGPALAHKATAEAAVAAASILGDPAAAFDPAAVPAVVFSDPEIATVGLTVEDARAADPGARSFRFPLGASARAVTLDSAAGFVELVADGQGTVVGAHLAGPDVAELAGEAALAIELAATVEDLAATIHPHPTVSESVMEAALGLDGRPLHVHR